MARFVLFYENPTMRLFALLLVSALVALLAPGGAIALPNT